jgi:hypothetical protein
MSTASYSTIYYCSSSSSASPRKRKASSERNLKDIGSEDDKEDKALKMMFTDSDFDSMLCSNTDEEDEQDKPMKVLTSIVQDNVRNTKIPQYRKGNIVWLLEVVRNKRTLQPMRISEDHFDMKAEDFEQMGVIIRAKIYVVQARRANTRNKLGLLPVFNRYDASSIDITKLKVEMKDVHSLVSFRNLYMWNRRILDTIERSIQRYMHRLDYRAYLEGIKRQYELVREYCCLDDRESVDPFDYLIRDNLDRQDNVPQARLRKLQTTIAKIRGEYVQSRISFLEKSTYKTLKSNKNIENNVDKMVGVVKERSTIQLSSKEVHSNVKESDHKKKTNYYEKDRDSVKRCVACLHLSNNQEELEEHFLKVHLQHIRHLDDSYTNYDNEAEDNAGKIKDECDAKQQQLMDDLISALERGVFDKHITMVISGKAKSQRHLHFIKIQSTNKLDFSFESAIVQKYNIVYLSQSHEIAFDEMIMKVFKANMSLLKGIKKSKKKSMFLEKYVTFCLQPEIIIKSIMDRYGVNYEDAEKNYLMIRISKEDEREYYGEIKPRRL